MNLFALFANRVEAVLEALQAAGELPPDIALSGIAVEPPRDPSHGDIAVNAALVLAKKAGVPPRQLAEKIAAGLVMGFQIRIKP